MLEEEAIDQLISEVGKKIKKARQRKGLTMRAVADGAGMEENNYSRFEKGTTNPTLKSLYKICQVLEIELSSLFSKD